MVEFKFKPVQLFARTGVDTTEVASLVVDPDTGALKVVEVAPSGTTVTENVKIVAPVDATTSNVLVHLTDTAGNVINPMPNTGGTVNVVIQADNANLMKSTGGTIAQVTTIGSTVDVVIQADNANLMKSTGGTIAQVTTIGSTVDVAVVSHAVMTPVDVQAIYQSAVTLWDAYNIDSTSTNTWIYSDAVDISTFVTKTCCLYSTTAGTLKIQTTPTSSTATWYDYYTDTSISADTYVTKSFTEAQYWVRLAFYTSSTGTLNGWVVRQTG